MPIQIKYILITCWLSAILLHFEPRTALNPCELSCNCFQESSHVEILHIQSSKLSAYFKGLGSSTETFRDESPV